MNTCYNIRALRNRWTLWLLAASIAGTASLASGDTVGLSDGSTLSGNIVAFANDTLTFHLSVGAEVRVPRAKIAYLIFGDGASPVAAPSPVAPSVLAPGVAAATGELVITFKDRNLSSKIIVEKKHDIEGHLHANGIMQLLIVEGDTVYARVDTVMDKEIFNGPEREYKNEIVLEDMYTQVPVGTRNVTLVIRNVGATDEAYVAAFKDNPLVLELAFGDVRISENGSVRLHVAINKGKLRLGKPRLVEAK